MIRHKRIDRETHDVHMALLDLGYRAANITTAEGSLDGAAHELARFAYAEWPNGATPCGRSLAFADWRAIARAMRQES